MKEHRVRGRLKLHPGRRPIRAAACASANLELNVPARPDTVFEIGSSPSSSPLQESAAGRSKLSVEDGIGKDLKDTPAAWANVTIRHLLTHTSGIKSYTGLNGFRIWRRLARQFHRGHRQAADGVPAG